MKNTGHFSMTSCTKTGIKIRNSNNEYTSDPFANIHPGSNSSIPISKSSDKEKEKVAVQYDKSTYETIDLNLENYSREELYKLFGFRTSIILTEEHMKDAKKIVLKTHPDKSRLDNKYFIFFYVVW